MRHNKKQLRNFKLVALHLQLNCLIKFFFPFLSLFFFLSLFLFSSFLLSFSFFPYLFINKNQPIVNKCFYIYIHLYIYIFIYIIITMDIPNQQPNEDLLRIRNIHPSQVGYGATQSNSQSHEDRELGLSTSHDSFSSRIGSFVTSYSTTSMNFVAENLSVPNNQQLDHFMSTSTGYRRPSQSSLLSRYDTNKTGYYSYADSVRPSIHFSEMDKVLSHHSTIADVQSLLDGRLEPIATIQTGAGAVTVQHKKSSFSQSIFNAINILMGIGIVSLPIAFKDAGWVFGILVFIFCLFLTNHTAKLLSKCLDTNPDSRTYGDLGDIAFGLKGRIGVTCLFITELIASGTALVILLVDGINALFPGYNSWLIAFAILTPMQFLPVRYLAYTSLLGIISAFSILGVLIIDGLSKHDAPGSLITPADTSLWPTEWHILPLSFGIIMSSFAGHAVFPTVYRDMDRPKQYPKMVNYTYLITTVVYFGVAACGYRMFGSATLEEITKNLLNVEGYNPVINHIAVWLISINPIAKYGLTTNPLNLTWQLWLFRKPKMQSIIERVEWLENVITFIGKVVVSAFIVYIAYTVPGFDKIMSLLGAFFSFIISGIFPIVCYFKVFGHTLSKKSILFNSTLLIISIAMAFTGTLVTFIY
ncbi:unnamed protein product [Cunninghamella blakesleeana]